MDIIVAGIKEAQAKLARDRALLVTSNGPRALVAAAEIYAGALREALPEGPRLQLPEHVKVIVERGGEVKAKVTGRGAHLYLGPTKVHEIEPRAMKALSFAGVARARAIRPFVAGHPDLVTRVRVEHQPAAIAAAREVLLNGL